jgi:transcriptional regulator with XRE-family HTH domain
LVEFNFTKDDVRALREKAGLTQQKAAESIQLKSGASWRDWELGKYRISKGTVEYFCIKNKISFNKTLKNREKEKEIKDVKLIAPNHDLNIHD